MTYNDMGFFFFVSSLTFWFSLYLLEPASGGLCLQRQNTVMKTGSKKQTSTTSLLEGTDGNFRPRLV